MVGPAETTERGAKAEAVRGAAVEPGAAAGVGAGAAEAPLAGKAEAGTEKGTTAAASTETGSAAAEERILPVGTLVPATETAEAQPQWTRETASHDFADTGRGLENASTKPVDGSSVSPMTGQGFIFPVGNTLVFCAPVGFAV